MSTADKQMNAEVEKSHTANSQNQNNWDLVGTEELHSLGMNVNIFLC